MAKPPRVSRNQQRAVVVSTFLSSAEAAEMNKIATAHGMSRSKWLRHRGLSLPVARRRERLDISEGARAIGLNCTELRAVGNNLNQLARYANTTHSAPGTIALNEVFQRLSETLEANIKIQSKLISCLDEGTRRGDTTD